MAREAAPPSRVGLSAIFSRELTRLASRANAAAPKYAAKMGLSASQLSSQSIFSLRFTANIPSNHHLHRMHSVSFT